MNKKKQTILEEYGSAKSWYSQNLSDRESLEQEWKDAAQLTLPYIFPEENQSESAQMITPYNSIGPSGVNTLTAKLGLALIPPTVFFRLLPDDESVKDLKDEDIKKLDIELAQVERDTIEYINQKKLRVPTTEALKLLVVTGNAMMFKIKGGGMKVFSPYQYLVQRDYEGNVLTACIKEKIGYAILPKAVQNEIEEDSNKTEEDATKELGSNKEVFVYTMIVRTDAHNYKVWQEIDGVIIEKSIKSYTEETLPYIILRWTTVNNENYGRGIVSQYLGDLRSLEGLTQTVVDGVATNAMTIYGVKSGSTLRIDDLNNAKNGQFVLGDLARDVTVLNANKAGDLGQAMQLMQIIEQRLSRAFMMIGGQIRDSERTTATEVRATAAELEATLGGVYSVLAADFQTPLIKLILQELSPAVLKFTTPSVTTGISAISRERDFQNLSVMSNTIAQLGPDMIGQYLNVDAYFSQVATSLGIDPSSIVKTREQQAAEQEQAMQAQQMQQVQEAQGKMAIDNNKEQAKQGDN